MVVAAAEYEEATAPISVRMAGAEDLDDIWGGMQRRSSAILEQTFDF